MELAILVENWDYKELTFGDFIAIMYFQRMRAQDSINKYKNNFTIEWTCENPDHIKKLGSSPEAQQGLRNTDNSLSSYVKNELVRY